MRIASTKWHSSCRLKPKKTNPMWPILFTFWLNHRYNIYGWLVSSWTNQTNGMCTDLGYNVLNGALKVVVRYWIREGSVMKNLPSIFRKNELCSWPVFGTSESCFCRIHSRYIRKIFFCVHSRYIIKLFLWYTQRVRKAVFVIFTVGTSWSFDCDIHQ